MTTDQGPHLLAEQVTPADVIAVRDFLQQRADKLALAADFHSDTYRVSNALQFAVAALAEPLLADLRLRTDATGDVADLERGIAERWNHLVAIAGPWEDLPGHDGERWQTATDASTAS